MPNSALTIIEEHVCHGYPYLCASSVLEQFDNNEAIQASHLPSPVLGFVSLFGAFSGGPQRHVSEGGRPLSCRPTKHQNGTSRSRLARSPR